MPKKENEVAKVDDEIEVGVLVQFVHRLLQFLRRCRWQQPIEALRRAVSHHQDTVVQF